MQRKSIVYKRRGKVKVKSKKENAERNERHRIHPFSHFRIVYVKNIVSSNKYFLLFGVYSVFVRNFLHKQKDET